MVSMPEGFADFHFLEPRWLLALLPLLLLLWLFYRRREAASPWRKIVDARLQPLLMGANLKLASRWPLWLLGAGWLLGVLALANPAWERKPQPLMQTSMSRVIVLDLSSSMRSNDLKPSRLDRARFKIEDMLAHDSEGQAGLVVFAGDAFTVTPLTRDADTIRSQLKALEPGIMPVQGSRADLGIRKALALLRQAGIEKGEIILLADGVEGNESLAVAEEVARAGHALSVLGVGTPEGVPLYEKGRPLRDASGKAVVTKLESDKLQQIATAGNGRYSRITGDASDSALLLAGHKDPGETERIDEMKSEKWNEQGPLLALLLLPLAALAFRRGWLVSLLLLPLALQPDRVMAFSWESLWQRDDQVAARALEQEEYDRVMELARDPARLGSAAYKQKDYSRALEQFRQIDGADGAYNRGNALARLGKYRQAIEAYDEALEIEPEMEDALFNKASVEKLLERLEQQKEGDPAEKEQQQESPPGQDAEKQQERSESSEQQQEQQSADQQDQGEDQQEQQQSDSGEQSEEQQEGSKSEQQQAQQGQQSEEQQEGSQSQQPREGEQSQQQGSEQQSVSQQSGEQSQEEQQGESPSEQQQAGNGSDEQDESENQFAEANEALDKKEQEGDEGEEEETLSQSQNPGRQEAPPEQQQQHAVGEQSAEAESLTSEEQMAAQQWLRRIPDDPGGLLRRKFRHQYQRSGKDQDGNDVWPDDEVQPW